MTPPPENFDDATKTFPTLVTGSAGFIGSHVTQRLLDAGETVVGLDNLNSYYDPKLKTARLNRFRDHKNYTHITGDLADRALIDAVFGKHQPRRVVHLAAQAGVRYAAENPHVYVSSNVTGTLHILEGCRHHGIEHLVFASTSSVYGANTKMPFTESDSTEHPLTLYAATKKSCEMMAHSYAHLYGIPSTGLRFFTVYGPWGRPDMALFLFTRAILAGEPIKVFNHGKHRRSFTYVDDIVEVIVRILEKPPEPTTDHITRTTDHGPQTTDHQAFESDDTAKKPDPARSPVAPYRIYNIGNEQSVELMRYIEVLEKELGKKAQMEMLPLQPGDVPDTESDVTNLAEAIDYRPQVNVEQGVASFVKWYRDYYKT